MSRKIAVHTGSRADYGPLKYIIEQLGSACVHIQTEGMYGKETIIRDALQAAKPDIFVCLGDRYETAIAALVAAEMCIPIAHINGGEITEGANDDSFRHCISKLSYWHFVAHDIYRARVVQLGEAPERVFVTGSPQIDAVALEPEMTKEELSINSPSILVIWHPETLGSDDIEPLLKALDNFSGYDIIIAGANEDAGGTEINRRMQEWGLNKDNVTWERNFSPTLFINLLRHCDVMVGNSSAGVIQATAIGKRVVNIGDRQKGRIKPLGVLNCRMEKDQIILSITATPLLQSFKNEEFGIPGKVSPAIVEKLLTLEIPENPRKQFYAA